MIPISDEQLRFTQRQESLQLQAYPDQLGLPTQGYGRRVASLALPPITEAVADQWLREDLEKAQRQALELAPNLAKYPRCLGALTDLCFNAGKGALDGADPNDPLDDTQTVKAFRAEDWNEAKRLFLKWHWGHTTEIRDGVAVRVPVSLPVLERRRALAAAWIGPA